MHDLEAKLGTAAPGRESAWRAGVLAALAVLDEATNDEYADATNPDSLLADIKRTQPRLRTQCAASNAIRQPPASNYVHPHRARQSRPGQH